MSTLTKKQYITLFSAFIIVGLIYFMPKSPTEIKVEQQHQAEEGGSPLELAIEQVLSGNEPPMKGILKIKELAEDQQYKSAATLVLGVFSILTNQKEKAVTRFEEFGSKFSIEERNLAEREIANTLLKHGNMEEVLSLIQKYKLNTNDEIKPLLEEIILEFKNI